MGPPSLLIWNPGGGPPPTPKLTAIFDAWGQFKRNVQDWAKTRLGGPTWVADWQAVIQQYYRLSFQDLARLPLTVSPTPPDFGGLGLSDDQLELFYVIGAGDGSWGAFFEVSALYVMRTLLFGYRQAAPAPRVQRPDRVRRSARELPESAEGRPADGLPGQSFSESGFLRPGVDSGDALLLAGPERRRGRQRRPALRSDAV